MVYRLDLDSIHAAYDEAIGAGLSSIRLSCREIRAFLFKGYWYNLIHDLSFQVGTCDGTSKTTINNMMHQETHTKQYRERNTLLKL